MATQLFAKWSKTGLFDHSIIDYSDDDYFPDVTGMIEITALFNADAIKQTFAEANQEDPVKWLCCETNYRLNLDDDGNIYLINEENSILIGYSGLTIINGVVITEGTPTPAEKISAIAEIENAYIEKQKAHFINGVEFFLSLKGEDYEQFKSSLTTSAITSGRAIVIIRSVNGIQYNCPDLPVEILKVIFSIVDSYSKINFDKKGVIIGLIMKANTNQELQTAIARKSEFESPPIININNICNDLLNSNISQDVIDWLNEKKEVVNSQNVYHIFTQSN